ncbi:unnamed protein product [Phytophthora lilii]|uniref:Unnamed protein product n=1 Tax=Phytophthora lilii TaxID=2077276 RepID=A0A9W6WVA2_9STRA|nr:unnamed protein product [Phytophthora lilii]
MQAWRALIETLAIVAILKLSNADAEGDNSGSAPGFIGRVKPADVPLPSQMAVVTTTESLLPNWVRIVDPLTAPATVRLTSPSTAQQATVRQRRGLSSRVSTELPCRMWSGVHPAERDWVKCGQKLFATVGDAVAYVEQLRTSFPNSTQEQVISLLNHSDIFIRDVPTGFSVCLGLDVPTAFINVASKVVNVVDKVLIAVVEQGSSLLSVDTFITFIKEIGAGASVELLNLTAHKRFSISLMLEKPVAHNCSPLLTRYPRQ